VSAHTAPAEHQQPSLGFARHPARARGARERTLWRVAHADALWPALLTAGILCAVTFVAGGGLRLGRMTSVEMALTLGSGATAAGAVMVAPANRRAYGLWPVGLLLAFTALSALSVVWSVQPDESFEDAGRMLAYGAVFAAAVALARAAPARWPALLGGVTLAAVVVCGYALLTKVLPDQLDAHDLYARLRAPYSYWNAIGLTAALGAICCMWLGARRHGHALLSALAYPAMGLSLLTLMLAYSRGALAALAVGLALWFAIVPLRLRGAAVLLTGAACAGLVVAWDFSNHALSSDEVALGARASAGHQLGALLVAMLLLLTLAGLAIGFVTGRRAPSLALRRRAGALLLALLLGAVLALAGALAASHRGFTGTISHAFRSLTDPHAPVPPNTPGRLTAIGSVRARYWNEALKVFQAHPVLGAGALGYRTARLRYRGETLDVTHAHGFVVQTLADLGLVGLALALALLAAWMAAAGRATHPCNRRWTSWRELRSSDGGWRRIGWRRAPGPYSPERIALLGMLCVVVVFGVHSLVDWTWYVPGDACVALLCAGWLAGRGPLQATSASPTGTVPAHSGLLTGARGQGDARGEGDERRPSFLREPARMMRELGPTKAAIAAAALLGALLAAWAQWQPQRSVDASQEALALLSRDPPAARAAAQAAVARDPLSVQALLTLATVQRAAREAPLARATLQRAVRLQPSNPQTWLALGEYDLAGDPKAALNELRAAIYLDPESIAGSGPASLAIQSDYSQALRAATPAPIRSAPVVRTRAATAARPGARPRSGPRSARSRSPRAGR
jgi:O-antigen ligase